MPRLTPFPRTDSRFVLLTRLLLVLLSLFFLLRLLLTFANWNQIPHNLSSLVLVFAGGLLQDAAFSLYALIPPALILLLVPQRLFQSKPVVWLSRGVVFLSMTAVAFILAAEVLFWQEFSTRFNFIAVDYLVYRREVTQNIYESYPMSLVGIYLLLASILLFSFLATPLKRALAAQEPFSRRAGRFGLLLLLTLIIGWSGQAGVFKHSTNNYVNELATNGPYQFVAAFRNNTLDYRTFYTLGDDKILSHQLKEHFHVTSPSDRLYDIARPVRATEATTPLNVILITVESLSAKYMTRFHDEPRPVLTPFLDKLATQSLFFSDLYATGTRTTRGLEAITLSLPPTPGRSLVKRPDNGPFYSLGGVLKQHGYDTEFLYGGRGFFDNMNAFFSGNGYRIIDEGDYGDNEVTFKNAWGVCDEDLYNKTLQQADNAAAKQRPFFFQLMTTSNHRPYTYPDGKIDIPSGTGREGAVRYTDYALEQFFAKAHQHDWFNTTVFVVVADHCAGSAGKVGLPIARYHIPLFIYSPANIAPQEFSAVASQMDLAPTLLGLLRVNYTSHFLGEDLLAPSYQPRALIGNYQKLALYRNNRLVILEPQQIVSQIDDPWHSEDLLQADPQQEDVQLTEAYYQGADYLIGHNLHHSDVKARQPATVSTSSSPHPIVSERHANISAQLKKLLFQAICCGKGHGAS